MLALHKAQQKITSSTARYRLLRCGRRFGKTTDAISEMVAFCLYREEPVAYFATTKDQARDIAWADLIKAVEGTTNFVSKNETRLEVTLQSDLGTNTIRLYGWENIETARGKKFSLVVLDELDSMRAVEREWEEILFPTLLDIKGSAIFMGTPKGYRAMYRIETAAAGDDDWETFHFTSYDNPMLDPIEIEKMKKRMTPQRFAQEILAEYKKMEGLIYESFDRGKHMVDLPFEPVKYGLSIDFGYNHPFAAHIFALSKDDHIHIVRSLYKNKLNDEQRSTQLKELISDTELDWGLQVADSEDPIAIMSLNKSLGLSLKPVLKGKDSVISGITKVEDMLHNTELTFDPKCEDLAFEFENYEWKKNRDGMVIDEPVKENDDALDALRYAVTHALIKEDRRVQFIDLSTTTPQRNSFMR